MIVDLHSHYAMHLVPEKQASLAAMTRRAGRRRLRDRSRALLLGFASRLGNHRTWSSGPRVTMPCLRAGGVRVALSVLYQAFDEMDLGPPYGAPPSPDYLPRLLRQLEIVETDLVTNHAGVAAVARSPSQLEDVLARGEIAFVHCVEGGFHLGATAEDVDRAVTELARRGVAYITLAHLFWRQVATNTNAIPFLPDWLYDALFPQPRAGLTSLGRAAVRAMVREGVLVDLAHMTPRAIEDTFAQLDALDPAGEVPVLVTHAGFRFGGQEYMVDEPTARRVARRGGVIGLILAQHQLNDGVRRRRIRRFEDSVDVLIRHIDRLMDVTGGPGHVALGTDLDGFIKPTLAGIEDASDLAKLDAVLADRYGRVTADALLSGNALRVLRAGWGARRG